MLDLTPKTIVEREALRINPAKTCQPIGAMYAALGIHNCLPHSHGSQGCCAYHRSQLTRHFKEPVMASTSSFTEGASVFGGSANLLQAINTIFMVYKPDVIAVHTTCLSETIGDDLPTMIKKAQDDGSIPAGKRVFHANTPSYVGSHITGFANMTRAMAVYFAEKGTPVSGQINVIPGFVNPPDMREMKRLATIMGLDAIVMPDTSDVMDTPQTGRHEFYPKGGVTLADMARTGSSTNTIALGTWASEPAGAALEEKCGVPSDTGDLPIGLSASDRYVHLLRDLAHGEVSTSIVDDRGKLIDIMGDYHQYFYGKKVAVAGDPDHIIPLCEFLRDLNMRPVHVITGTPGKLFERRLKEIVPYANVRQSGDLFQLHQWMKNDPVDLLIGNTYCKFIARAEDVPFVRFGFPVLDRMGQSYFPVVGYRGAMLLLKDILSALMERQDRDAPDERFELAM